MSLGRLLAAGKSLVGTHDGAGRYRVNKHAVLPKFISPRNPFARPDADAAPESAPPPAPAVAPSAAPATAKDDAAPSAKKSALLKPAVRRAAHWLGEWRRKANPWSWSARRAGPVKRLATASVRPPVQSELSLDKVQVVRNDLSDADFEIVPRETAGHQSSRPARLAAQPAWASPGGVLERLATRFFGDGQP